MKKFRHILTLLILLIVLLPAESRFPKPEFETDYQQPLTTTPAPDSVFWDYFDIAFLFIGLSLASYLSLKKRSRQGIFNLVVISVLYFGFFRKGCVCSVGSLQNFALALGNVGYQLPIFVGLMFFLPLLFTLFFSRSFCSSICPLGAIQDLLVFKPMKVPAPLAKVLSIIPYFYLGFAVLLAFTNSGFIICRYDPFINLFRLSAGLQQVVYTVAFLVVSALIARPYCRFLCPYGILLGWMSWLSPRKVTITPDECVQCKLCENSCPFDAIQKPTPEKVPETRKQGARRIGILLVLVPLVMAASGFALSSLDNVISRANPTVRLAEQIRYEEEGLVSETTLESDTFRTQSKTVDELYQESEVIIHQFYVGGWILGAFIGLVFSMKLFSISIRRKREDYITDPVHCLSCGRCWDSCPVEHKRLRKKKD